MCKCEYCFGTVNVEEKSQYSSYIHQKCVGKFMEKFGDFYVEEYTIREWKRFCEFAGIIRSQAKSELLKNDELFSEGIDVKKEFCFLSGEDFVEYVIKNL